MGGNDLKRLLVFASSVILAVCVTVFALPVSAGADEYFDITAYNIDITIDEMNVYHVREQITVRFKEQRHGIYRYIPHELSMNWEDEQGAKKSYRYRTFVKNIRVEGYEYSVSRENGITLIRIGDPDEYVSGTRQYNIEYDHELWDDGIPDGDMVYYNLIGTEWECDISGVNFSVTLPKSLDAEAVKFYYGAFGEGDDPADSRVSYTVDAASNTISGTFDGTLKPREGLTIFARLPEGYFSYPPPFPWNAVLAIGSVMLLSVVILLFVLFGRDDPLVTPVEFYPPDGITPAEAGYIIDGKTDDKDVVSLILYWASKGCLSIERESESVFRLKKLAELPENAKQFERYMFGQLFKGRTEVTTEELKFTFYEAIEGAKNMVADHYSIRGPRALITRSSLVWSRFACFLSLLPLAVTLGVAVYNRVYEWTLAIIVAVVVTTLLYLPVALIQSVLNRWYYYKPAARVSVLVGSIVFCALFMLVYVAVLWKTAGLAAAGIASALSAAAAGAFSVHIKKHTVFGAGILGKLLGFRNFIERAEKDRIERLVEQNPSYFYDVLPYAYVLGVTDKWAKRFEGIAIAPPAWYTDTYSAGGLFTAMYFQSAMLHSMSAMRQSMVMRPAPKGGTSGGGFGGGSFGGGGGGFSGGGFGGGGGGSW